MAWTNTLQNRWYMCIQWTRALYSVVITWQSNPPISQFNSSCNEFPSVWSMFVYNTIIEYIEQWYLFHRVRSISPYYTTCLTCLVPLVSHSKHTDHSLHIQYIVTQWLERLWNSSSLYQLRSGVKWYLSLIAHGHISKVRIIQCSHNKPIAMLI